MKLITLNIWGAHVKQPLLDFFIRFADVDIFCLQEIYHHAPAKTSSDDRNVHLNALEAIHQYLPEHNAYFRPVVKNCYGIAIFAKKELNVTSEGEIIIHEAPNYSGIGPEHQRNLQYLHYEKAGEHYTVMNVHGLWNGKGKTDSPARLKQSQAIRHFMDSLGGRHKILCGDFNLRPDTQSLQLLQPGMVDLIQQYGIISTRTSFYPKAERYADYVFTSPDIPVTDFRVLPDEVSDHAALLLEYEPVPQTLKAPNLATLKPADA